MKSPNPEITETGRRKGRNKKNERFRENWILFFFVSENEQQIEIFFLLCKKNCRKKVKNKIKFNHKIVRNYMQ